MEKAAQRPNVLHFERSKSPVQLPMILQQFTQQPELPFTLSQALNSTLDLAVLIDIFAQGLQQVLPFDGLKFANPLLLEDLMVGHTALHSLHYNITLEKESLGSLLVSRAQRFKEQEITVLENMLTLLIYPLRNIIYYQRAVEKSLTDPLTAVGNRSAFNQELEREIELAHRHKMPLSLLVIDADDFKALNDQFGHRAGDAALQHIVHCLKECIRGCDLIYRYGGEEFAVMLTQTLKTGGMQMAERTVNLIAQQPFYYQQQPIAVTVSIGVGALQDQDTSNSLFERADQALYAAKNNGKNRACCQ